MKTFASLFFVLVSLVAQGQTGHEYLRERAILSNAVVTATAPLTSGAVFVDAAYGSDTNAGTAAAPWRTIGHAGGNAPVGATIYVAPGTYLDSIQRGGVVWQLSDGATLAKNGPQIVFPTANTNITILGSGAFERSSRGLEVFAGGDQNRLFLEAKKIVGVVRFNQDTDPYYIHLKDAHINGGLVFTSDETPSFILFENIKLFGNDSGVTTTFSVVGSVATNNPTNANRQGAWVPNAMLPASPLQ